MGMGIGKPTFKRRLAEATMDLRVWVPRFAARKALQLILADPGGAPSFPRAEPDKPWLHCDWEEMAGKGPPRGLEEESGENSHTALKQTAVL